jgi:GAF domain-containing protein/HAMP domain-containing protein
MPTEPAQTNSPPTNKRRRGMRLSIRTKITFWAGLCLFLVSLILIGYSVLTLRQTSIDNATKEAIAIAEAKVGSVKSGLDSPLLAARTLASALSAIKDPGIPISLSREEANGMLRKILIENPSFLGTYTLWEPNGFDGLDSKYIRAVAHDETGRFIPYWVRGDNGIIHTEALAQYEIPGTGDWYILPRSTKKETTIAPLFRRIQSQDVVIASFIIPIVQNNIFYGIAGVDAPIGFVQQLVDEINLYDGTTNAVLFTDTGTLIAVHQQPQLSSQPANLIYEDFENIQAQLDTSFTRLSPDGKYLQIFSPIDIGEGGTRWVLGLIIPFEKITAPATIAAIRQVAISMVLIVLALIFLWFLARQIVRPLQVLTDTAKAVSQGDLTVTADVHSNDEAELLANTFNTMTSQLRTLFATLEQRVAERTADLASANRQSEKRAAELQTVSEVARAVSTEINLEELLTLVTNVVSERFGFYHVGVFLLDNVSKTAMLRASNSPGGKRMVTRGHKLPIGQVGIVGHVAASGEPRIALDVGDDATFFNNPDLPETRSEMALPLNLRGRIIGVLDVQSTQSNAFTQADVETISILADQVAIAIENARLLAESKQALAESQTLYGDYIGRTWEHKTKQNAIGYYHASGAGRPIDEPVTWAEVQTSLRTGRPAVLPSGKSNKKEALAAVAVPIRLQDQVIGILDVRSPEPGREWSEDEIAIIEAVAERLALALENARLFEETSGRAAREHAVAEITSKIRKSNDPQAMIRTAIEELQRVLGVSRVEIVPQVVSAHLSGRENGNEESN